MLARVLEFGEALRRAGIPISTTETSDALRALEQTDLHRKDVVRGALATTMVKTPSHRDTFDTLFELYFGTSGRIGEDNAAVDGAKLRDQIERNLLEGDEGALAGLARQAIGSFGKVEAGRVGNQWYSNYEVARALRLDTMLERLLARAQDVSDPLEERLRRDELERRIRGFRALLLADTRSRAAQERGPEAVASYAVAPPREEASFLSAFSDPADLRRAVRPLARKLATRLAAKRRRSSRGLLDMRRTVRRSLGTGGVPFDAVTRRRVPHRPELVVLCDVSSSVARFSQFSLMLTHALSSQFSKVRSFVFVDDVAEVTDQLDSEDLMTSVRALASSTLTTRDAHSDHGEVLGRFNDHFHDAVGPKTTLLILGDARNNYRGRNTDALRSLRRRAHHVYWLNPEDPADWDTGDSIAGIYAEVVDKMVGVRNLRQLQAFIAREL